MDKDITDHVNSGIELDAPSPPPLSCLGTSNIYNVDIGMNVWDKSNDEDIFQQSTESLEVENSIECSEETKEIISPTPSDIFSNKIDDGNYILSNEEELKGNCDIDENRSDSDDDFGEFEGTSFTVAADLNVDGEIENDCSTSSDIQKENSNYSDVDKFKVLNSSDEGDGIISFSKTEENTEENCNDDVINNENVEANLTACPKSSDVSDDDFTDFATCTDYIKNDFSAFDKSKVEIDNNHSSDYDKSSHSEEIINKEESDDDFEFGTFSTFDSSVVADENVDQHMSSINTKPTNTEFSFGSEHLPVLIKGDDVTFHGSEVLNKLDSLISRWLGTTIKKENHADHSLLVDYVEEDAFIWNHLVDVENSLALKLNWNSLSSKKNYLNSLDVDARNILYKNKWSTSIPIFAQTLSFSPLTPARFKEKKEHSWSPDKICTLPSESQKQEPNSEGIIPPAKFDWSSSGLTNPLETPAYFSPILDFDFLMIKPNGKSTTTSHVSSIEKEILTASTQQVKTDQSAILQRLMDGQNTTNKSTPISAMKPEVQKIISQLPDLNYMKAKVFMFPINQS